MQASPPVTPSPVSASVEPPLPHRRRREALRLLAAENLLDGILSNLPVIVSYVDKSGLIYDSHGCTLAVSGMHEGDLVGMNLFGLCPAAGDEIRQALAGGEAKITWSMEQAGCRHHFDTVLSFDKVRGSGAVAFSVNVTARVNAETERNRKVQLLASIMKNLPVVAGRIDERGRVSDVQGDGLAAQGLSGERLEGRIFWDLHPQCASHLRAAIRGEAVNFVLSGQSGDKDWHVEFFAGFDGESGSGAIFFGRDITRRRWLEEKLINITDAEQQRIGADLHDSLGQQLTGLSCLASALSSHLKEKGDAAGTKQAKVIMHLASDAIAQSRALARGLCPVQLEKSGLNTALEDLTFNVQRLHGVECQFIPDGGIVSCDHRTALHLYRITQEAINNAIRHAAARHIRVFLRSRPPNGQLIIEDDGKGFDAAALPGGRGVGLSVMHYRATIIGAGFHVDSRPGHGARVECEFVQQSLCLK